MSLPISHRVEKSRGIATADHLFRFIRCAVLPVKIKNAGFPLKGRPALARG